MLQEEEILMGYKWINDDLFQRLIKCDYPNAKTVEVVSFSIKAALAPGENYASQMLRALVNYKIDNENVKKSFVIKTMVLKKDLQEMLQKCNLFEKEIRMFNEIIPKTEELLHEIGDDTKFAAKCYEFSVENQYLVFEDLSVKDYKNVNRRVGLDMEHFRVALSKIAKFHACGAILHSKGHNFSGLDESPITEDTYYNTMLNTLRAASEAVKRLPKYEHLSGKFLVLIHTLLGKLQNATKFNESDFTTLCHGDLWMNNVMFKFDQENTPIDAILVDFQFPWIGPAILDVINMLYTSSDETIRDRELDLLVQYYHKILSESLQRLNYPNPIPTLTGIQMQFLEKSVCSAAIGLVGPGFRTLENKGEDLVTFLNDPSALMDIMINEKSFSIFEFLLDYFDRKGYFD